MTNKVKTGRTFGGVRYGRKMQSTDHNKALETAEMYRNRGAKARVISEKTKAGTLWVVYRRG